MRLNEVVLGDCYEVHHYLLNKYNYLKRNNDISEKQQVSKDLADEDNELQFLSCCVKNSQIHALYLSLLQYIK